jgi:hypothetical protein
MPKLDKVTHKKENHEPISLTNLDAKLLKKYWQTKCNNASKRSYTMVKLVSFQGCRDGSTNVNH